LSATSKPFAPSLLAHHQDRAVGVAARFEVGGEGELTLKLDLNLEGGVMSLTSTRS
jgi:hypothetical protein